MMVMICGSDGRMGRTLTDLIMEGYGDATVVRAVEASCRLRDFDGVADVLIDFSHPAALPDLLSFAAERQMPLVIATTGHTARDKKRILKASGAIPILYSPNLSGGMQVMEALVTTVCERMPTADIEIVERHRRGKADAPSGTALRLTKRMATVRPALQPQTKAAKLPDDIGLHSLRLGEVGGSHTVIFDDGMQSITLTHEVHDRRVFAKGALDGAAWLIRQPAGLYTEYGGIADD